MTVTARMQAVIPFASNLPTDVITNTLWFVDDTINNDLQVFADAMNPHVQAFYDTIYAGTVANYLANPGTWEARWYDTAGPPPHLPYILPLVATSKTFGASEIPTEVACVLSFQGAPMPGQVQARRRGRIYLGGLHNDDVIPSGSGPPPVFPTFTATLIERITNAAEALQAQTDGLWVVWSTVNDEAVPVTNGWVDNTPDTQRRRGVEATSRVLWPS